MKYQIIERYIVEKTKYKLLQKQNDRFVHFKELV